MDLCPSLAGRGVSDCQLCGLSQSVAIAGDVTALTNKRLTEMQTTAGTPPAPRGAGTLGPCAP